MSKSKKKKSQSKPESIQDALGPRAETGEKPVDDGIVEQALQRANLEERLGANEQYPESPMTPPQENASQKIEEDAVHKAINPPQANTSNPPDPEPQTTPASKDENQPATETFTPASQEQTGADHNLRRLQDFIAGPEFNVNWVRLSLTNTARIPNVIPSPTLWAIPANLDVAQRIHDVLVSPGYVESVWPALRLVMGNSIDNVYWTAGVLSTFGLFDVVRLLPGELKYV
jgi:hypothetical protein